MKTSFSKIVIGSLTASCLMAVSCQKTPTSPIGPTVDLRLPAPFKQQSNDFAFQLANQVIKADGNGKNTFISPLSLHIALGMLLNGANGQTAQEIQKMLNLDAQTVADINETYNLLMKNLPNVDPQVTLQLANSIWYRTGFSVEKAYQEVLQKDFLAEITPLDFTSPASVNTINQWASQHTNGKIQKVLDKINPDDVLFLLNALYFKGNWKTQFDPAKTVDEPFTLASGIKKDVRMMRLDAQFPQYHAENYTAIQLPYGADKYAMTVLLPNEGTSPETLLADFTDTKWTTLQTSLVPSKLDFGLPKFTFSYEVKLNPMLQALGMKQAFTDQADLTKINAGGKLSVSFVKQNTFVAVDEKGTEAAAVTTVGVVLTSMPMPTLCNRPFAFVIHEKSSGAILFIGKIADPTQT